jgi:hypothetical protein
MFLHTTKNFIEPPNDASSRRTVTRLLATSQIVPVEPNSEKETKLKLFSLLYDPYICQYHPSFRNCIFAIMQEIDRSPAPMTLAEDDYLKTHPDRDAAPGDFVQEDKFSIQGS